MRVKKIAILFICLAFSAFASKALAEPQEAPIEAQEAPTEAQGVPAEPQGVPAEPQPRAQPYTLEPVIVIAPPAFSPLEVSLDPKRPQQPVPASDATGYLQSVPGFSAIRTGGANSDMVFRGMFGSRLNVLTNGGYMFGGCGGRMDSPASYISPENFDSVTIVKGPQTVLWGGGGSAATILFDRTPPKFTKPEAHVRMSLLAGSYDRYDQNVDAIAGTERVYIRATGNHAQSGDYTDGSQDDVPSKWMKWNTDVSVGITPDPDTVIEFSGGTGDGEARYADRGMDGAQFKRTSFGFKFEKGNMRGPLTKAELQAYYNYVDHIMDNYSLRSAPASGKSKKNPSRRVYGGRLALSFDINEDNSLISGVDMQFDEHRTRTDGDWSSNITYDKYGVFSELTSAFGDNNALISGIRLDYIKAEDLRGTSSARNTPDRDAALVSGFIRFERTLKDPSFMWYAGVGYAERFPDFWELNQSHVINSDRNAFTELKPEKTLQLDVGAQYSTEKTRVWLSAYAGAVSDYIMFRSMQNDTYVENIDARIAGAEAEFSRNLIGNLHFDSSLAYSWGEMKESGRPLPQIPPLEGRLGLRYEEKTWDIGLLWRLAAPQKRVAQGYGNVKGKDFSESPGFGVVSINGSYKLMDAMTISAGVDNLFDKTYSEHLNRGGYQGLGLDADRRLNEPGINAWCKVSLEF